MQQIKLEIWLELDLGRFHWMSWIPHHFYHKLLNNWKKMKWIHTLIGIVWCITVKEVWQWYSPMSEQRQHFVVDVIYWRDERSAAGFCNVQFFQKLPTFWLYVSCFQMPNTICIIMFTSHDPYNTNTYIEIHIFLIIFYYNFIILVQWYLNILNIHHGRHS